MPIVQESLYLAPHLKYDAPVNEKTKKVREMFDVDEQTGYPRHYNWRAMSRLGPQYNYEDPFIKFGHSDPKTDISTKVTIVGVAAAIGAFFYYWSADYYRRPFWTRLPAVASYTIITSAVTIWGLGKTRERQGIKNAIAIDYVKKHPDRFGPIERPKLRELLYYYTPAR